MRGWFGSRFNARLRSQTGPFGGALLLAGGQPLLLPWGQPPTSLEAPNMEVTVSGGGGIAMGGRLQRGGGGVEGVVSGGLPCRQKKIIVHLRGLWSAWMLFQHRCEDTFSYVRANTL